MSAMKPGLSLIALLAWGCPGVAIAAGDPPASFADEVREGFYSRINALGFLLRQETVATPLNPGNLLGIPRDTAELDLRPDFNLKLRQFEFDFKPRFQWAGTRTLYFNGFQLADRRRNDFFVNEASVRYHPGERLILSYGREILQWGPSALLSPSNPFNANNGRNNPNLELPGMNYGRAVFVASPAVTFSLIANTGEGRLDPGNRFHKKYAAKFDYTGDGYFLSLVGSHTDGDGNRIGAFAGWNVSDALALHAEGSAGPKAPGSDAGVRDRQLLVGASYTMEAGPVLWAEYYLNNAGCPDMPVQLCLLRRGAFTDPLRPLARRRYAMLQYVDTKIGGKLNLSMRLIRNIDDHSGQLVVNLEYELGQHWQLYAIPTFYHGSNTSEFGSLLHRSLFLGAAFTF
jgi:hypothetical protein